MTTHAVRTNRLAIISFASGLLALLCIAGMLIAMSLAPTDYDLVGTLTSGILLPLRDLSVLVALVTGILALREIKQKKGAERGKTLAWLGIAIGIGWIALFILAAVLFFLLLLASRAPEGSHGAPPMPFLAVILVSVFRAGFQNDFAMRLPVQRLMNTGKSSGRPVPYRPS